MPTAKHPFRLAMDPLTQTIYAGRVRQREGYAEAIGVRHDVTSDFLSCIIQYAESYGGSFSINANGAPTYEVVVRRAEEEGE
jgi:hypothetical protein